MRYLRYEASRQRISRVAVLVGTVVLVGVTALEAQARVRIKKSLAPTVANPAAQGKAAVTVSGRDTSAGES